MARDARKMSLSAFIAGSGHHPAAWRQPDSDLAGSLDLSYWIEGARTAERGKLDAIFFADVPGSPGHVPGVTDRMPWLNPFEPLTLLSALAVATTRIGLICTSSTTYNEPYNLARQFASLDHISRGRAAWNVVTTQGDAAARNFGQAAAPGHADRYDRAAEFLEVAKGLWDSWDDGAFGVVDKAEGIVYDAEGRHVLDHRGRWFAVKGPLNLPRPPQGHPVIVQAGASDAGRELAARTAEVVYTPAQTLDAAQAYYADVKGRMARYGRRPEELLITPGIYPVVGETHAHAEERYEALQDGLDPAVGLHLLSMLAGTDLSGLPVDGPLPELPPTEGGQGRFQLLVDLARTEGLTLRQLYLRYAVVRGHHLIVGTATEIADELEEWFRNDGADGFNLLAPLSSGLAEFVDRVVPELQRRGLFRTEYEGTTLREHLGLARPASRWAEARPTVGAAAR